MIRRLSLLLASFVIFAATVQAKEKKPETRPFELVVVDLTGAPVAGALLTMKTAAGAAVELSTAGLTDALGKVTGTLPDAAAAYNVTAAKERFRSQEQLIDLAGQKLKKGQIAVIRLTLEPLNAHDDYATAIKAIQAKDYTAAEASLKSAVTLDPQLTKGYEVLAMVQLEQKQWAAGLASADQALALEPDNLSALRSRYDALLGLGNSPEADAALADLAAKDRTPDTAKLLYNAGAQAVNAKAPDRARALFVEALAVDPKLYQAHAALAEIAIADKRYGDAVAALDQVLLLAPRNFKAFERKIEVLKADGKTAEADAAAKELAALKAGG